VTPVTDFEGLPTKRYLGVFGVGGWATRSGTDMLLHGQKVTIERQKLTGKPQGIKKPTMARRKTQDIVVRFKNPQRQEVGRFPQETAEWVSTLIDQKICTFEGTCVYAPERIRTNDTIYLQVRIYMLRDAFARKLPPVDSDSPPDFFGPKETEDEKAIRLRQVALVKLFAELGLEPVKSVGVDQNRKRSAILQSTELLEGGDEKTQAVQATPSDSDTEEGKELEQDQLDALYSKSLLCIVPTMEVDCPRAYRKGAVVRFRLP